MNRHAIERAIAQEEDARDLAENPSLARYHDGRAMILQEILDGEHPSVFVAADSNDVDTDDLIEKLEIVADGHWNGVTLSTEEINALLRRLCDRREEYNEMNNCDHDWHVGPFSIKAGLSSGREFRELGWPSHGSPKAEWCPKCGALRIPEEFRKKALQARSTRRLKQKNDTDES